MVKEEGGGINDHEFKVYSQWGEDGIIQFCSGMWKSETIFSWNSVLRLPGGQHPFFIGE